MDMRAFLARPGTQAAEPVESAQRPRAAVAVATWDRLALGGILALSALLNFYALSREGYGNSYYAAAVKSMLQSWHNFFFVSFDPGGFVTVNKPPLGFWIQVVSARIFGFNGWSLILPEALAGVLAVALLYHLVRRAFGSVAGLIAALALAVTPVLVATNRSNIVDSLLVLAVLLGAWAVLRATETGRLRWLLASVALVGIGFNIKMLQAFLVVPAFFALYLLGTRLRWRTRIWHLAVAGIVLLVVSLSWATAVDLTPASQRPYVGSSSDNSEYNLIFGYNGLERLIGHLGFGRGGISTAQTPSLTSAISSLTNPSAPGGFGENGTPGLQRLLNLQLGGQAGWLLPLALLGIVALGWRTRPRLSHEPQQQQLLLWGLWLLTGATFFSVAGFFHSYYLVMIAPPIAALAGAGLVAMWHDYRESRWRAWLLPASLLGVAVVQAHLLAPYPTYSRWMTPAIVGLAAIAALVLLVTRFLPRLRFERVAVAAAALGVLGLLLAPTVWAAETAIQGGGGPTPIAGPRAQGGFGGGFAGFRGPANGQTATRSEGRRVPGPGEFGTAGDGTRAFPAAPAQAVPAGGFPSGPEQQTDASLIRYLQSQQGNTKFLVAVQNANTAAPIILETGKPVMALGGFLGSDPILTPDTLATLVSNGTVRFFLLSGGRGFGGGFGGTGGSATASLEGWVGNHCTVVPTSTWQTGGSGQVSGGFGFGGAQQLYDCGGARTGS